MPCCYDYDSEMKVGNVFETPFTQIWNNSQYRQLRKKIYHDMPSIVKCNHCGINFKLSENGWFLKTCDLRSDQARIPFSIIMPTYNRKHCIKKAIDSLLTQTYQNFELIIIDDGSTDGTEEYLTEIYKEEIKKERIRIIKLPKKRGVSFARNQGVGLARYHWIAYLDTDNQMRQDFLETFADRIEKNASYEIYYAQIQLSKSASIIGHEFNFDDLIQFNFIDMGVFVHSAKIYHEMGGFDVNLDRLVDWDLIIKYTEKYPPLFIDKVLLDYDDNTESPRISNSNKASADEAYKHVILKYYERLSPQIFIERHAGHIQSFQQALAERDGEIQHFKQAVAERDGEIQHFKQAVAEYDGQILVLQESLAEMHGSRSWRITAPLRYVGTKTRSAIKAVRILPQMVQKGGGVSSTVCKAVRILYKEGFSGVKARLQASLTESSTALKIHECVPAEQAPPSNTFLTSQIYRLQIPLAADEETGWKPYPVFHGSTAGLDHLACHVSVLINGHTPHPPHTHQEEELLLLLEGEVDLIFPGDPSADELQKTRLKTHEFVYYPAGFAHTLESVGKLPAQYLMIKWHGREMKTDTPLSYRIHGMINPVADTTGTGGFHPQVIFEGPTSYLKKLQCHSSLLSPGAGYAPHADPYDVFIIVLEGELETLGARATPYDVIFYQAGVPHGMRNPGESAAQYLVFEFHS